MSHLQTEAALLLCLFCYFNLAVVSYYRQYKHSIITIPTFKTSIC
jgi:hypothetical protein